MQTRRFSFQREQIYQALCATAEHPTAEMLYQQLKPTMPRLSLGTVYRNLHQMAQEGRVTEIAGAVARFDAEIHPHTHLLCSGCGGVMDLPVPYDAALDAAAAETGAAVDTHSLMFYGLCPACAGSQIETKQDMPS